MAEFGVAGTPGSDRSVRPVFSLRISTEVLIRLAPFLNSPSINSFSALTPISTSTSSRSQLTTPRLPLPASPSPSNALCTPLPLSFLPTLHLLPATSSTSSKTRIFAPSTPNESRSCSGICSSFAASEETLCERDDGSALSAAGGGTTRTSQAGVLRTRRKGQAGSCQEEEHDTRRTI